MSWIIPKLLAIIFVRNSLTQIIEKCYTIIEDPRQKFAVSYYNDISFIPENIYVEYYILDKKWKDNIAHTKFFNAKLSKDLCSDSGLIFPDFMTDPDEESELNIRFYNSYPAGLFERFEAIAWKGFDSILTKLTGLEGMALIQINFVSEEKQFPSFLPQKHDYSTLIGSVDEWKFLCIKLFKRGAPFILKMSGQEIFNKNFVNHILVTFITHEDSIHFSDTKIYFGMAYICDSSEEINKPKISTSESTKILKIEINIKGFIITSYYERNKNLFVFKPQLSNVISEPVEIEINTIYSVFFKPDALFLYKAEKLKQKCPKRDDYSYVEVFESNGVSVTRNTFLGDDSELEHGILKLKPATTLEMEICFSNNEDL